VGFLDKARALFGFSASSGFGDAYQLASPFSIGTGLAPVIASDLGYSGSGLPATPLEALSCPPIYRGISLYSTLLAGLVLEYDDGTELSEEDAWMNRTEGSITPGQRHAALLQDLIFHRDSAYWVQRDGDRILGALKLPRELWGLDWLGNIVIGGRPAPRQEDFIYFQSLMPLGFLESGASSVEHYHDIRNTVRSRSKNPIPMVELHITSEFEGTEAELTKAQKDWSIARAAENGAVAFTPNGIELIAHTSSGGDSEMLIAARNAARLDFANFLNLPAALLEGANGTSGTYENTLQTKDELVTLSLATWTTPIEQRLSQPDVTKSGKGIRFRTSDLTSADVKGNTGTATPTPAVPVPVGEITQ
jgi:hypothetical protein